jgi:hypothetical protein
MPERPNPLPANSDFVPVGGHVPPLTTEARDDVGNLNAGVGGLSATLDVDGTLAANSDTRVASQKATKTYVGAETTRATAAEATKPTATLDVDGTLAANSDTRVASQKATKTYVGAETTRATAAEATKPTATLDVDGTLAANSDTRVPSQKAVVTYVAAHAGGITNGAANNIIPKSDGTNLVTSRITDAGTQILLSGTRCGLQATDATRLTSIGDWNSAGNGTQFQVIDANAATAFVFKADAGVIKIVKNDGSTRALPTADPHVDGQLWDNLGIVNISHG